MGWGIVWNRKSHVFMSPSREQQADNTIEELRVENERLTQRLSELEGNGSRDSGRDR
jgi:hypothetical protein